MRALLKKIRLNTLLSNGLWGLLGAALLLWPAPSARAVCLALGAVLLLCGAGNLAAALPNRTAHSTQHFGWVPVSSWQSSGCGFYSALFWPPH